jgi:hypothetical protein
MKAAVKRKASIPELPTDTDLHELSLKLNERALALREDISDLFDDLAAREKLERPEMPEAVLKTLLMKNKTSYFDALLDYVKRKQ